MLEAPPDDFVLQPLPWRQLYLFGRYLTHVIVIFPVLLLILPICTVLLSIEPMQ